MLSHNVKREIFVDRKELLAPLGMRLRVLDCLGGNMKGLEGYFEPSQSEDIHTAFHLYVKHLSSTWATQTDEHLLALLAAARFMCGEINAAKEILSYLPKAPIRLDHGAGYCFATPFYTLSAALPLPQDLSHAIHWIKGSNTEALLQQWIIDHTSLLYWNEIKGIYTLK